ILNEHRLKFNSIKDAKKLLEAIEKRFGRNIATKKTQRNRLKQQFENFSASRSEDDGFKPSSNDGKKIDKDPSKGNECNDHEKEDTVNNTNNVNTVSSTLNAAGTNEDYELLFDPNMPALKDVGTFDFSNKYEDDGEMADMSNVETTIQMDVKSAFLYGKIKEEVQVNAARLKTTVNAARSMSYLFKTVHSTVERPIHKNTSFKNGNVNQRVNTVKGNNVNTARPKAVVNVVKGNLVNAVKASALLGLETKD
nr:hypothetical protein [Tanacetum cinerariifolium]